MTMVRQCDCDYGDPSNIFDEHDKLMKIKKMSCFRCGKKFDRYTGRHLSNNSNLCLDFKILKGK